MFKSITSLTLCLCLYFTQIAPSYGQLGSLDYSNSSYGYGSMSLAGNPLEAPKCERPKKLADILNKANSKYSGLLAPKQSQLNTINSQISQANIVASQMRTQYEAAIRNVDLTTEQKTNYRQQYEAAVGNVRNLESQRSQLQGDISGINQAQVTEVNNINTFKQYDTVEAYLEMAVSQEDALSKGKGMEIIAVADVGRRLQCTKTGDTMSESYSIFKQASNAFSVNMSEDTQDFMSRAQLDMIEECKSISDAKEAQYQALQRLLKSKMRLLQAASDKMITVQALADGFIPALEAARREQQDKSDRQREANRWVKESEVKVDSAKRKVKAAEKRVAEAEQELKDAKDALAKAKAAEKKAEQKKMMMFMLAAIAAMVAMMMCSNPLTAAACPQAQTKKMLMALAAMLALMALMQKKVDTASAEARVREAEAELKQAKYELAEREEELKLAEAELEQAMEELDAANIHTHLSCTVRAGSELAMSLSGAENDLDDHDDLEDQKSTADSFIRQYLTNHEQTQPQNFPEPESRIRYLEYVTTLSSSGLAQIRKVERNIQNEIQEIQGIMTQMNNITISPTLATGYETASYCMDAQGRLDTQCNCRTTNSCLNGTSGSTSNSSSSSSSDGGFNISGAPASLSTASSGNFTLAQAVGKATQAQLDFANATFSGNAAAANVARTVLNQAANSVRALTAKDSKIAFDNGSNSNGKKIIGGGVLPDFDFGGGSSGATVSLGSGSSINLQPIEEISTGELKFESSLPQFSNTKSAARSPSSVESHEGSLQPAYIVDKNDNLKSDTEVAKSDGKSIFDIITSRYQESAYPILLNRKASGF